MTPSWHDIGKLAAIALIRTFLNYFLERDMAELRDEDRDSLEQKSASTAETLR